MAKIKRIRGKAGKPRKKKIDQGSVGGRFKFIRGNLTKAEFGELLGAHRNTVRGWEDDDYRPNIEFLLLLQQMFNADFNWLLTGKGEPYLDFQEPATRKRMKKNGLGERLKYVRGDRERKELCEMLGAHRNSISRWEAGSVMPGCETLALLGKLLDVDLNWLITGRGEPYLNAKGRKPPGRPKRPIPPIIVINQSARGMRRRAG